MIDAAIAFRDAIAAAGLVPPDTIIADGILHRFASNGSPADTAGWYVLHADGVPAGAFGDWRTGSCDTWRASNERQLSSDEERVHRERVAVIQRERETLLAAERETAAAYAERLWQQAKPAGDQHPYLRAKGIHAHGIRQRNDRLVIPVRSGRRLCSLQFVPPDGRSKRFLRRGAVAGGYFSIGKPNGVICIAEGFATGASVHESTGHAVAVAFNAGNLEAVARAIRSKFTTAQLIVCADDDCGTLSNPGLTKAIAAAQAANALIAIPDFGDDRPADCTDFNDLHRHYGPEAVKRAVNGAKAPGAEGYPSTRTETASDPERPRFNVVTMLELINANLPEPELLLAPWLVTQGLAQVHAWRGTGKTHFSLGVAYAVASAGKFLRWQAPKPEPVLFLDGEMPAVALQQRLRAILKADDRDIDVDESMLRFLTPDLLNGAPPDLADADDQQELQEVIDRCRPRLIVVDNISTLVRSGGTENDADAWVPVQAWALRMRRLGLAVLFVHHTGKGGLQRGTSKREDVLDAVINLKRPTPYNPADGARFIVEFEKARYIHGDDTKSFEAQLGLDPKGHQIWTTKDIEESTMERVLALTKDGLKPAAIAKELSVHRSTVSRALKRAKELGLSVIEGGKADD